jgi:hypothetical protein
VYRIEGEKNTRVLIDEGGRVLIVGNDHKMLHINFRDLPHAEYFFQLKSMDAKFENPKIKAFEVRKNLVDWIRSIAIDQEKATLRPEYKRLPQKVDASISDNLYGLRAPQIRVLRRSVVKGSGRIVKPPTKP